MILGDAAEAEDATQGAFIRAYKAFDHFDHDRPLRPWLLSITANTAKNYKRSMSRYINYMKRLVNSETRTSTSIETLYSQRKVVFDLHKAIKRLDDKSQQIIYIRYFLDISVQETDESLMITEGTVKIDITL